MGDVRTLHRAGALRCGNCGGSISPNELSFSCDLACDDGSELLVSCYRCAPALMEVLDDLFESGRTFRDGWQAHCAGAVDSFGSYGVAP